ncbi:putative bifunctional diguanylate cyclase/phosphodiesterase [Inhella gelatinilytica]|uniref:EAL domain-containing protein n=1 Tax=Inhella gelatinilytica TaxID=2795030 RepID=A0A931ISJ6_9BURK|nr:EAL domain-containing protein [Inhella gelatinilytica]MBH9551905.1 EAL domain-containing protein [Inhella gelatinilytica]
MPLALPAFLNPRRIEGRIVLLFLALLMAVQLASFSMIRQSIEARAEQAIEARLGTAGRMLQRLLMQQSIHEQSAAELLAADYGFRSTLATGLHEQVDRETLTSALTNNGERVGAAWAAFTDTEQALVASTRADAAPVLALVDLQTDPEWPALVPLGPQVLKLTRVPVNAPTRMGHVLMGFALDNEPLSDLKRLTNVDAMFVLRQGASPWKELVSLLEDEDRQRMGTALADLQGGRVARRTWGDQQWRAQLIALPLRHVGPGDAPVLAATLWASFDEEVAPYRQLQWVLLGLTLAGVAAFALGSVFTARRISTPIQDLAVAAERLGRGDYSTPVSMNAKSLGEVRDLAQAFESMRVGIQAREAEVHRLAYWDPLTGLPNREQFSQRLQAALTSSGGGALGATGALLMLDMDRFKTVNDVLGHAFGDRMLCGIAERLKALNWGEGAVQARLSGDEFALWLPGLDAEQALAKAQQLLKDFETPLTLDDQTVDLGAGVGLALAPEHGPDANTLMANAELAMYAAKRRQNGCVVYDTSLDAGSQDSLSLLSELRHAVEHNELRLFLQPKVDFRTGQVKAAEALVRWQHPTRGLVPPMQFIPFAEQTGFIRSLTTWVMAASAQAAAQAQLAGLPLRISVNLSTRDLLDHELPHKIMAQLAEVHASTEHLCLEITESAIMDDPQRAQLTLDALSSQGFKLSIDDFGTGYSSLAYLKRLPVDELKIDRSFVMAMETDADDAKIVHSTIELAHNLGLSVVAEGVETARAWELLRDLGCDEGQGYFIGKPMPQEQFLQWLRDWKAPVAPLPAGPGRP